MLANEQHSRFMRALSFLRPFWKTALLIVTLTLLTSGLNSLEPMVQKILIDALTVGHGPAWLSMSLPAVIIVVVAAMAVLTVIRSVISGISNCKSWNLQLATKLSLLDRAVGRIYNFSLAYHQSETIGSIMTRLDRGINGFSSVLFDIALTLLPSILYLACTIVFMTMMDGRLTLIALFFAPIPAIVGLFSSRISAAREKKLLARWMEIYSRFHEGLNLIKTVKSFGMEETERKRFLQSVDSANGIVAEGVRVDTYIAFAKNICMDLGRLTILLYGGLMVVHGELTIGALIAFLTYTGALFGPMLGLAGMYETLRKTKVYLDTIFDIIEAPDSVADREGARDLPGTSGSLEFQHVSFAYRQDRPLLRDVSFTVKPGSMVALVGPSGSGKTTIVDLINRYYDPDRGAVRLDGFDLRDLRQQSVRSHIGMVLQESALFNDTIKNNILCGRPSASDEEVYAAARAAGADRFIERKPDRYETIVGERGVLLSGGERQRLAIARAILKNPQIFIFDEASSNLDAESEELVQKAIAELAKTKTVFIIAHRLSTIKSADLILVLSNGEIVEQGTHDQLLQQQGLYYKLVSVQALPLHAQSIDASENSITAA